MRNALRFGFSVAIAVLVGACGVGAPERPAVEVVDSADVTILTNTAEDVPLEWQFEPVLVLGGADDGPESFYQVGSGSIGVDAAGNLNVLDRGSHHVLVFDGEGGLTRTIGREGGGPGEFQWPSGLVVWPDGAFAVADFGKRGLVRFSAAGEPLEEEPMENWNGSVARLGDGTVVVESRRSEDDETMYDLLVALEGEGREILSRPRPQGRTIDLGCVRISGMVRLFAPSLVWAAGPDFIAAATGAEYVIDVYEDAGKVASVRRTFELRETSRALALQEVGDEFEVSFGGGGGCEAPAERVVEEQGYTDVIPAVGTIAVAPDGTLWVQRREVRGEERAIDIFVDRGEYVGTLPPGTPFPVAFMPDGAIVAVERDDFDVPRVVVYEVPSPTGPIGEN